MSKPSKKEILASSSAWVASILNFFPGLGAGYLYQRRWLPYFLTIGSISLWIIIGIILQSGDQPSQGEQLIGILGLFIIAIITALEASLAHKKVINQVLLEQKKEKDTSIKKGWFR